MGLDQYAFSVSAKIAGDTMVDLKLPPRRRLPEIAVWRKHPNLHGWMEQLYRERGGVDPQFNCATVRLTAEDLDQLEKDVTSEQLPVTGGFFFGKSTPEDRALDLAFIERARIELSKGRAVFYDSWW